MYYGFLEGEWFFAIRYTAVERYYFQKEVKTFEKMLHTFNPPEADEPASGGQGFNSTPLGALRKFPIDTPSACGGVV